ncbi:MAG: YceI family protein [Bacteroidota bacterium]|nr:YceI family protein [Bacteroidota bacterium]
MKQILFLSILLTGLTMTACKEKTNTDATADTTENTTTASSLDGTYTIDAANSQVKWQGAKPTGVHNGVVPISSGNIVLKDGIITSGQIDIDMTGIAVTDLDGDMKNNLEGHLKGIVPGKEQDFFNVNKFPKATYTIKSSAKLDNDPEGTHMINGTLTVKDISKPVNFKAKVQGDGNMLTASTPQFGVDRTEFDIKFKSAKFFNNLQDDFVNDDFKLQINISAKK